MAEVRLEVRDLSRRFGGLKAVDGLQIKVHADEIVGLLGPNGSGKTTAINLISGVLKADSGTVTLEGTDLSGAPSYKIARDGIGRTFQLVRLFESLSTRENVIAGMAFRDKRLFGNEAHELAEHLLERVGLPGRGDTPASDLTYMDQKKVELARALAGNPRVLLLDEWLAGLNPTELREAIVLVDSLKEDDISILMVEHVLEAVRSLCDHCVVMNAGAPISYGTPSEVLNDPEVIRAYLGDDDA